MTHLLTDRRRSTRPRRSVLCRTTLAAFLLSVLPVAARADDADGDVVAAIAAALAAAQSAQAAAAQAAAAAQSAQDAIDSAGQDANAIPSADAASQDSANAGNKADDATSKAQDATNAAKAAQSAAQGGDTAAAKAAAAKATADAAAAKADSDAAKAAADDAKSKANAADNRVRNDALNGLTVPPDDEQKQKLANQKQSAKEAAVQAKDRTNDAKALQKLDKDFQDEQEDDTNQQNIKPPPLPGQKPAQVPYHATSFFDVFIEPDIHLTFPNEQSPFYVPQVDETPGNTGLLFLDLTNDNSFAITIGPVYGGLFGDAVTFSPFTGDQILPAFSTTAIELGQVTWTGPFGATTFADFSLTSDAAHPGLGPVFEANFTVATPEPSTFLPALLAAGLGLAYAGRVKWRAKAARPS